MKRFLNIIFVIFLFMIGSVDVSAEVCDAEDIANVKEMVKNITYHYDYVGDKEFLLNLQSYDVSFDFGSLDGKIYITESVSGDSDKVYHSTDKLRTSSGSKTFYVFYDFCAGINVGKIQFQLKKFNEYSLRDECFQDDDFGIEVCEEWYQGYLNDDIFLKLIRENKNDNSDNVISVSNIMNIIREYYFYFIGVCVLLIIVIVVVVVRYIKGNRLD